jgi:hypothetical protein
MCAAFQVNLVHVTALAHVLLWVSCLYVCALRLYDQKACT